MIRRSIKLSLNLFKNSLNKLPIIIIIVFTNSNDWEIFRALFILMGETKITDIEDNSQFWIKCAKYLKRDGIDKIGSFILEKSKVFDFSHKTIYLLNKLLV